MASRRKFLAQVWEEIINGPMSGVWIDNLIAAAERHPQPFEDVAPALKRLLAARIDRRDLSIVMRHANYEAVFGILYMLEDPGVDDPSMLHEDLLTADPSGLEGRLGSASGAAN